MSLPHSLDGFPQLKWINTFARELSSQYFYSKVYPSPIPDPYLVAFNEKAAIELLDLEVNERTKEKVVQYFSGNQLLPGSEPIAQLYAGHQFGEWVPELGDGRAILLGEIRNQKGETWELHLKGSGKTPYSRFGDGRAVLRSTIREYLASEAMHYLGVPTTRALCIVGSKLPVLREEVETAAMMLRLAPTHIRFGHFEIFAYRRQYHLVKELSDYVIRHFFPHLLTLPEMERYRYWFEEIVKRTAYLIAKWQAVGFTHGVMNTDNMSILGITIDYGPFGFMEEFNAQWISNSIDDLGRYAFDQQPEIAHWNLKQLAIALSIVLDIEDAEKSLNQFMSLHEYYYLSLMRQKLGFRSDNVHSLDFIDWKLNDSYRTNGNINKTVNEILSYAEDFKDLVTELLLLLQWARVDYTNFFRQLPSVLLNNDTSLNDQFAHVRTEWREWVEKYKRLITLDRETTEIPRSVQDVIQQMNSVNPKFVLRTHLAHRAIKKAKSGDFSEIQKLLVILQHPFDEQPSLESFYTQPTSVWSRNITLSCSS